MKNKKSQAAMEFILTYGWAVLAVLIITGILLHFYFNYNKYNYECAATLMCYDNNLSYNKHYRNVDNEIISVCRKNLVEDDIYIKIEVVGDINNIKNKYNICYEK